MWSLWNSRNDCRHGKSPIEPGLAVEWAIEVCFHLSIGRDSDQGRRIQEVWTAPAEGTLKVNVEGAVVRCSFGTFRAASARWLSSVGSALLAEAEALREGVRLIPARTQHHVVAEMDAQ